MTANLITGRLQSSGRVPLPTGAFLRGLCSDDIVPLTEARRRNRDHLAPWDPERPPSYFTVAGQGVQVEGALDERRLGRTCPLVIDRGDGMILGQFTLSGIVRGHFRSAYLGYWVDAEYTGRGLATAAVAGTLEIARCTLGLHRIEAATLRHNGASQAVLARNGFRRIGTAERYLRIAGEWQDHVLFQRLLEDDAGAAALEDPVHSGGNRPGPRARRHPQGLGAVHGDEAALCERGERDGAEVGGAELADIEAEVRDGL